MEEFDCASSENSNSAEEDEKANLWMCGASKASMVIDKLEWCKEVMNDAFIPIPYPKEKFELVEWAHCLASIDVCTVNHSTKFCDEDGYDIVPIQMIGVISNEQDEMSNIDQPRKRESSLPIANRKVLPPWDPSWRESSLSPPSVSVSSKDAQKMSMSQLVAQKFNLINYCL